MSEEKTVKKSNTKVIVITAIILVAAIAIGLGCYFAFAPKGQEGSKEITVDVVHADKSVKTFKIKTDEEFLRGALEQEKLVEGSESEYGLFVTAVDGEAADDTKQEWWCFTKGGASVDTGIDSTPIADGDKFEITLTVGW